MPSFHHVNLGVPPDEVKSEEEFLLEVLGYRRVEPDERLKGVGARWFEADDGSQVHLSEDPDHRPAARAHVALAYGRALEELEHRLERSEIQFQVSNRPGFPRVVNCRDPAGNLWELRGEAPVG